MQPRGRLPRVVPQPQVAAPGTPHPAAGWPPCFPCRRRPGRELRGLSPVRTEEEGAGEERERKAAGTRGSGCDVADSAGPRGLSGSVFCECAFSSGKAYSCFLLLKMRFLLRKACFSSKCSRSALSASESVF